MGDFRRRILSARKDTEIWIVDAIMIVIVINIHG